MVPSPCDTRVTITDVAPSGIWNASLMVVHSPAGGTVARLWNARPPSASSNSATTSTSRSDW